ncbi:MAG: hypothetical protein C4334_06515 [Pyrinomonas sp.]|uniref:FliM/FliN family flagellar motor switch protein n=1 Tax=Pyrinomonas sp. TaxID=2080306 RepID=UPI003334172B
MRNESFERAEPHNQATPVDTDPFASDIFLSSSTGSETAVSAPASTEESAAVGAVARRWQDALPKIARREAQLSFVLDRLPPRFSAQVVERIRDVISNYGGAAELDFVGLQERSFAEVADDANVVTTSVVLEPTKAHFAVEMDAHFVLALVAQALGEDPQRHVQRPPSRIEQTVFEFLILRLLSELNAIADGTLFRLSEIRFGRGVEEERGFELNFDVRFGEVRGLVKLLIGAKALAALASNRNLWRDEESLPDKLERYRRIIADIQLSITIGEAQVDGANIEGLERGDIVLLEGSALHWFGKELVGKARIGIGETASCGIIGHLTTQGGRLKLEIERFAVERDRETERLKMAEEETKKLEANEEAVRLLDGLMLTVRVEMTARRLTLDELARLRIGQILDLGCSATDPVALIVDGKRIATGELVDVEGRLGVRILQLSS